jgi:UDP-GlcNAc:undecaprenyl-phosphate/decaprenyl-phosphate GlcNAc-1-phosphate transferase
MKLSYVLVLATAVPFIVNILVIPLLLRLSHRFKWYDDVDHRKIHTGEMPRIGGVGIFLSFLLGLALFYIVKGGEIPFSVRHLPLLIGFITITTLGLVDDFINIRPLLKILVQIGAALVITVGGFNFRTFAVPLLHTNLELGYFSYIITCFWIVGMSNAVNLVDGIDGLAGGLSAIAAFFIGIISLLQHDYMTALFALALFGSILGFLVYNFPPAKLFMGDSGSLFLGFSIAVLPLIRKPGPVHTTASFVLVLTLMIIPFLDTLAAILRRLRRKKPIHSPDRDHLHHKLLTFGLDIKQILIVVYVFSTVIGITLLSWVFFSRQFFYTVAIIEWIVCIASFLVIDRVYRRRFASS